MSDCQNLTLPQRALRALDATDNMTPELRACVHEFGYAIVYACINAGVKRPNAMRALVKEIWDGARQPMQTRQRAGTLDWLLLQVGAGISAATLMRVLANADLAIVPLQPREEMIAASMAEVSDFTLRVTKHEKHRRRLRAAIVAGMTALRPNAFKADGGPA